MISVLFVDDNTDLFGQIRSFLEKGGDIRLDSAHSIKQAIEKIKGRTYDVIVSYEQIPEVNGIEFVSDMNGIEFLQYLKSEGNATPVILLCRRGNTRIAAEEITNASEIRIPKNGDIRPNLPELITLIKQTMLRRKAERELKVHNEQLTTILSATPLGIFQVRNHLIAWVNRTFTQMLGYEETQLVGKDMHMLFKMPEDFEIACRELQVTKNSQGFGWTECRLVKKDSSSLACQVQVQMADPRDTGKGGTFVVTDISERKKIADALKESEAKYREVLQNTQSIIIRMDTQGTITFFNHFALSFFDYASDEVIGKNVVGTIVPQKTRPGHDLSMMANDLGFNAEGYAVNISENIRRNGDRVWIAWINKAIRNEQGHIIEVLCIGNDITDRKRSGEVRISTDTWKDMVVADTDIKEEVFDAIFHICTEISIEGREGKPVGTTFLIGDADNVMAKSRQISINAFEGQKPESRMITNHDIKENIKEFAQLDGAFVIDGNGYIRAQSRYITVDTSSVTLPKGMGTRHNSVAAMTQVTSAVGIVVSQSGGGLTIFKNGMILKKITI